MLISKAADRRAVATEISLSLQAQVHLRGQQGSEARLDVEKAIERKGKGKTKRDTLREIDSL